MLRALGSASCASRHETRLFFFAAIGVLHLVIADTRHGYDMLRALISASFEIIYEIGGTTCYGHWGFASCDTTHEKGGAICYGHWVLHLVISYVRQVVRFVTGIGFCIL